MKVLLCLKEKNIPFVSHYVDLLRFEQHKPEFVRLNPNGQVPVLVHDGAIITESTVINEYLEDVFPQVRLRPENPVDGFVAALEIPDEDLDKEVGVAAVEFLDGARHNLGASVRQVVAVDHR